MAFRRIFLPVLALFLSVQIVYGVQAHAPDGDDAGPHLETAAASSPDRVFGPEAACDGGTAPAVEGTTLEECFQKNITVGGNARKIRVWYTLDMSTFTVDEVDYVHGVADEGQASDVADAVEESWQAVFVHSAIGGNTAHEPYINGCDSVLNIQLRDGKGWSGIAYWGSPGKCNIGIDAPMVSNGVGTSDDGVVFHEVQHYTQYSYDDGCYDDFRPLYSAGNAWIEGWANLAGKNATNAANDADYSVSSYNSGISYYSLDYTDLHAQYLIEQYGGNGAPADPQFGVKAVYEHYRQCDQYDDIFVMDETIIALTGGAKTEKWAFVDFEAAYYAYDYADPDLQPELVFPDADDKPTGTPAFTQNVNMGAGDSESWVESSPDTWTGKYYRINPQAGCSFVELHVETQPPGGEVGINFMAVNTTEPSVQRSAHIGDNATRMFAGNPANDQLVVNVTSFDSVMTYEVTAECVTPSLNILEPVHNPGHAMVGAPDSPIATLTRFEVTSEGLPVSGIVASTLVFSAETDSEAHAATLVAGSFQEVGPGEYWAAIIPPVMQAGTTFADYEVCLNTSICDTEADALLYVDPGPVDTVYAIDESNSMDLEDTPGEGKRITNAKRAATVLADLLRDGDRIGIIGFGGEDTPAGCGLPGGDGNCPNDNIVRMARTDVTIPGTIAATKAAIGGVTNRLVWTNIGHGLIDAKDMLLANPGNTNPDRIILLSDGQENVNPLYDTPAVKGALQTAGVCVDTIGFGPEADGALMAQIAAENCGTYMPVPTSGLGTGAVAQASAMEQLASMNVPAELAETMATAVSDFYPGQLGLANANEYLDVEAQDSSRLFHILRTEAPSGQYRMASAVIDESVNSLQFLVAGKQAEQAPTCESTFYTREVDVLPPGADPGKGWIPISPPSSNMPPPSNWEIRNDPFNDVLIVSNPEPGQWQFRARYRFATIVCADQAGTQAPNEIDQDVLADFIMNLSVQSQIHLEGSLLNLTNGKANAGDVVPIIATLMDKSGLIPGANVLALVSNEGGNDLIVLFDDGNHNDGAADDGIYGFPYSLTEHGGSYGVRIVAAVENPANPDETLLREWNGGFWIDGPQIDRQTGGIVFPGDSDKDGMPDDWERRCGLIVGEDDSKGDKDNDGLINLDEFHRGTLPCRADTDGGGERDGSEVNGNRNPLLASDDKAIKIKGITLIPLNQSISINWSQRPDTHIKVFVCVSLVRGQLGPCSEIPNTGQHTLEGLENGTPYYVTLYGEGEDGAQGDYSDQMEVTPKEDPIPPQGAFFIGGTNVISGGDVAISRTVTLFIDAVDPDGEVDGPAGFGSHSIPHGLIGPQFDGLFQASGDVEMRFANTEEGIAGAEWEPLADTKEWQLGCEDGATCTVFGQFRDGAGNESLIIDQQIELQLEDVTPPPPGATLNLPFVVTE
jgi:hypothetical protein